MTKNPFYIYSQNQSKNFADSKYFGSLEISLLASLYLIYNIPIA